MEVDGSVLCGCKLPPPLPLVIAVGGGEGFGNVKSWVSIELPSLTSLSCSGQSSTSGCRFYIDLESVANAASVSEDHLLEVGYQVRRV